jgi:putative photosynthetic complex assembly protein
MSDTTHSHSHPGATPRDKEKIPLVLVRAMFGLALASLILVAYARITDRPMVGTPDPSPVVIERSLILDGDRTGAVAVLDGVSRDVITTSDVDKNGFISTIWRVLGRQRMQAGAAEAAPVILRRHESGRMSLLDTGTGKIIQIVGYGPDNMAAFAKLLD